MEACAVFDLSWFAENIEKGVFLKVILTTYKKTVYHFTYICESIYQECGKWV